MWSPFPNMHLNLPVWCSERISNRIELNAALHSVEMSVFRQITATQMERTEADGCLVWHTRGEYSVCSFLNLTGSRQMFDEHNFKKTRVLVCFPADWQTFFLLRCTIRNFGTLSLGNCFIKHKVLKGCVPVICLDCHLYVTTALQCFFGVEVFDSFHLCSTLVLHAVQLHLFSQRTVCRDVGRKKMRDVVLVHLTETRKRLRLCLISLEFSQQSL